MRAFYRLEESLVKSFDYIVVRRGTAAWTLVARLSQDRREGEFGS
jgi:hypothetical protein